MRIELTTTAWKAVVLPLNYTRIFNYEHKNSLDLLMSSLTYLFLYMYNQ